MEKQALEQAVMDEENAKNTLNKAIKAKTNDEEIESLKMKYATGGFLNIVVGADGNRYILTVEHIEKKYSQGYINRMEMVYGIYEMPYRVGINSNAKEKEQAKDFVRLLFSEQMFRTVVFNRKYCYNIFKYYKI